jgi:DNA-binding transcriptional LysR family regulator
MLLEGIGITWLPLSVVAEDLREGRLVCLEGDNLSADLRIIVYRRRKSPSPTMEDFWRHIGNPAVTVENRDALSKLRQA